LSQLTSYLQWVSSHGFNSMGRGFHDDPPNPYSYPVYDATWYSIETPAGNFNTTITQAAWMDQYLNEMDKYQLTYWLGLWALSGQSPNYLWDSTNIRSWYNF